MIRGFGPCCVLALIFLLSIMEQPSWLDPLTNVPVARPDKIGAVR
jgi:hypothetical protein